VEDILHLIQVPLKNVPDVFVPSGKIRPLFAPLNFRPPCPASSLCAELFYYAMPLIGNMKPGDHP
jgi:hypothetical protein